MGVCGCVQRIDSENAKKSWGCTVGGWGGQGGCVLRIEVIVKMQNQSRTNGPINAHLTIAQV